MQRYGLMLGITILFCFQSIHAFEIGAYHDPLSTIYGTFHQNLSCGHLGYCVPGITLECADENQRIWYENLANNNEALRWLEELGVTSLNVIYPFDSVADWHNLQNYKFNGIDDARSYGLNRYFDAQHRTIVFADPADDYVAPNTTIGSWGIYANQIENVQLDPIGNLGTVLSIPALGFPDTLFRPARNFGQWWGWDRRFESKSMPLVATIRGKVDSTISGTDTIARLDFFCKLPDWWQDGNPGRAWVKFGSVHIRNHDFDNGNGFYGTKSYWIVSDSYDYFSEGDTAWTGELKAPLDSTEHEPQPFKHSGYRYFDPQFEYRFAIISTGVLPFSLYDMSVSDLAYYEMFEAPRTPFDSLECYKHQIGDRFRSTQAAAGSKLRTWHFDEWNEDKHGVMARVAKIVNDETGKGIIVNGGGVNIAGDGPRKRFYDELDQQGAYLETETMEFYPFDGDSTCWPNPGTVPLEEYGWDLEMVLPGGLFTDYSSDVPYATYNESVCQHYWPCANNECWEGAPCNDGDTCWGDFYQSYEGKKSLQCALDMNMWGIGPAQQALGLPSPPDSFLDPGTYGQIKFGHDHGTRVWAVLESNSEGIRNIDNNQNAWRAAIKRAPTPNEIKLTAWLSVAMDADGIMWYHASSLLDTQSHAQSGNGGLLEYPDSSDFCGPKNIIRTGQYFAAKEVCNEIHEIAPTLEALDFVKTYASRAFEQNYGANDSSWCRVDTLDATGSHTCWITMLSDDLVEGPLDEDFESSDSTYIQISRFMSPGKISSDEDYWFFLVNRRALPTEDRTIYINVHGLEFADSTYTYELMLQKHDSTAWPNDIYPNDRRFRVHLEPGEAELVHFYRGEPGDIMLTGEQTLRAPAYYNRNVVLDGAQVTIKPDTAAQRYQIMRNGQWEDQWKDSLEILFAPGKGIKMIEPDSGFNKLTILGNDSTQIIMKCSKGNEYKWAGIESNATRHKSSVTLRNTTIANATFGLKSTAGKSVDSLVACEFINNRQVGVYSSGYRQVYITDCKFERNGTAIQAQSGTIVRGRNTDITKSKQYGILATRGCTLDLNEVSVRDGLGEKAGYGGIRSVHSDNWMKCCKIENNKGVGIEIYGGSLLMANVDTVNGDFGDNWVIGNSKEEIVLADGASFSFARGHNSIYDPNTSDTTAFCRHCPVPWLVWENYPNAPLSPSLQGNYWNGVTDTSVLLTDFAKGLPFSFSPFLTEQLGCNELPHGDSPLDNCISEGVREELQPDFSSADANYRDILESTVSSNCNKPSAVNRLLAVNYLSTSNDTVTQHYLVGIQDTSSDSETRHAAAMGIGLSLSENFLEMDSAKAIYQQIIDSSDGNIYRKIDGQVGKLLVEMREQEADSIDGLTSDELTVFMDSLDQILGQRFVWTKYEITDTVVMHAPVRVDSVINIRGDGVLTILPHPGYRNPVVEFADKGAIKVWGTDTTKAKGKLYVYGQPDSRITLHWEDSTGTKNIYSERGFVKVKHARLYGNGFVNQSQDAQGYINGLRRATFQADSCSFSWFDEGVMARATDTTSYMRACTLAYMGGSAQYSGFGAGLILLRADGFLVEDCVFDGNDGVGIYHALATDVVIRNSQIINGAKVGVFGASSGGGDCRIECSTIASNGDTLPELRTYGVTYDLVGGHNTFSDSLGSLIYATDPSFVDLEEGENSFELLGSGRYLQSGDTNDVWDATWNTWYPLTPEDSGFYSNLWPTTTTKWTIDSSLANFVSCDMPGASSMGGDSWLIVGDDPVAGTMSTESDDETTAFSLSAQSPNAKSPASKNALDVSKGGTTKTDITKARQEAKAERIAAHHQELAAMRALKKLPAVDRRRLAMMLVKEGRVSEFEPVALGAIARGAVWHDPANTSSKFLLDYGSRGKDRSKRDFAKRLGYQALAQEGHPADAIAGLEELMRNTGSPRDSILALMDAMSIYYEHHNGQALQPLNSQIAVDDPYDLVRRTLFLSELLESGGVSTKEANSAIPTSYALYQNYPNPFNPNTEIRFDLPEAIHAELKVFNILGQEVVTLVDDVRAAGAYRVFWDGKNAAGLTVASGVYIYQIKTPNFTDAKKMMLIR